MKRSRNAGIRPLRSRSASSLSPIGKLERLLEYSRKNFAERHLDDLLPEMASQTRILLDADRCSIFILDKSRKVLWSRIAHGTKATLTIPLTKGIAAETVKTGRVQNIRDAYGDPRFNRDVDRDTGYRTRTILSAPMKNLQGEVLGVFQVLNKRGTISFGPEDEKILAVITGQAAVAVENAQLYDQVREAVSDTILRLSAAAECKDRDTGRHILRMSRVSAVIAEALDCPKTFSDNILLASPMHDIGKLGVPDAILSKPGRLTEEEIREMRKHTIYGGRILKGSSNEIIQMSERIALCHHEKFDGSGYPRGLAGKEIPLEARITALADVFDALTNRRAYKDAYSLDESLKMIRDGAGSHFDPKVVDAFFSRLDDILACSGPDSAEVSAEPYPAGIMDPV